MERAQQILDWWFDGAHDDLVYPASSPHLARWFGADADRDEEIRRLFEEDFEHAAAWKLGDWAEYGRSRLALVIVYDQFTRALRRGTIHAFDHDKRAQNLSRRSLADGSIARATFLQQFFLLAPLGRSEDIEDQEMYLAWAQHTVGQVRERRLLGLSLFDHLAARAKVYYDTVDKYGRFPQRNAIMGRESTSDEEKFLKGIGEGA